MKKPPKLKKGAWFYKVRGSYLPATWQGWLLYVPFITFLVGVAVYAFRTELSFAQVFFSVFPAWVAAAVVLTWIASNKS